MLREPQVDRILAAGRAELSDLGEEISAGTVTAAEAGEIARCVRKALLGLLERSPLTRHQEIKRLIVRYEVFIAGCSN